MSTLRKSLTVMTLATLLISGAAFAKQTTVKAEGTKFDPLIVNVEPGDTVNWTNMDIHNVHFMFQPDGAKDFKSEIGQNVSREFSKEGIYVYQCDPHIGLGMGGAVVVGHATNLDDLKAAKLHGGLGRIAHKVMKAESK
ncbi:MULTISPECIES: plastocyanin/azurin family copper-binding protein [unclassified Methylophaga]|jgi:pseudoazurin|uniref:plastocyanin/azurin family copper-binding protein n=1 Tax=unclassified Methylophaga TaxID=2629249 RepID=UPI0023B3DDE9|nr:MULTISPECIES: plastocyanin/azurin family copper-binding protein [unclassified Methylophaga]|tara:strand:- start:5591 stop:6007 length:417 start_codon:yes stop_codon:yes gene_type:complete